MSLSKRGVEHLLIPHLEGLQPHRGRQKSSVPRGIDVPAVEVKCYGCLWSHESTVVLADLRCPVCGGILMDYDTLSQEQ